MTIIKTIHILCAIISIFGFIYRGALKMMRPDRLNAKWLKITPHIVDTLLLVSAIYLVVSGPWSLATDHWITAKIILLVAYIGFGLMALRFSKGIKAIRLYYILAVLTATYIVIIATNKAFWFV